MGDLWDEKSRTEEAAGACEICRSRTEEAAGEWEFGDQNRGRAAGGVRIYSADRGRCRWVMGVSKQAARSGAGGRQRQALRPAGRRYRQPALTGT